MFMFDTCFVLGQVAVNVLFNLLSLSLKADKCIGTSIVFSLQSLGGHTLVPRICK